jgi:uncharacterized phage protein (TIGR02220 family)
MNRGYIRLWRKFLDGGYVKNHGLCAFMVWCLLKANHQDAYEMVIGLQRITLKPGQFVFGRKKAAEETGLSEQEIRTIIAFLKKIEFLTIKTTNKFSVISIINWPQYQAVYEDNQPANQPTTNQQLTTNKNNRTKEKIYSRESLTVLAYVNEKTGRKYRDASHIDARLKDGGTIDDCRKIIDTKLRDPFFIENPRHLNPVTLFRKSHWDTYLNETQEVKRSSW